MINKYLVDKDHVNIRLDKFMRKYSKEESLSIIFSLIRKGFVKVNGKKSKENYRLLLNDEIFFPDAAKIVMDKKIEKEIIDIDLFKNMIVFEDEDVFIINKPNNMPMHKGDKHKFGLSETAKAYYNNPNVNFANRLDLETEGLVIGCKNLQILRKVNEEIRNKKIIKRYIAKVEQKKLQLDEEFFSDKKIKIFEDRVRVSKDGLEAKTYFKVIEVKDFKVLLDIELITGRKHQIRVHLSDIGHPIIGDSKYGNYQKKDRMYLKCYYIKFLNYEVKLARKFN
ncbi:pseudouridine synthase [Streptobacillus moniliformis]|uniref:Pseudouridine synthase n=1 Tax=Streptobacillus moniliformis (strain ATCC 14647 / DSM 12112 / NCTC 10651 / 9901) TaxID=519441 RepID=D1AYL9_STRM9|nr:RluA family pseudouridine synthase [Streptobacillus moniliformis]ACZ01395.1 pseudouridine synthase [Streptobacillus moniliformis DSM 12112]AVL43592.1 RluA family pseudouridine synthase [Streptobacillus moniliformis]QXW66081.1 RluA family pseudouridine synthase [Streptobacillus moniliformis]SQA13445.1 Ribosomal large subunit pseudouridine synthase C [Streptobacillus moniliformis]